MEPEERAKMSGVADVIAHVMAYPNTREMFGGGD